ncbi:hypothetical protein [Acrocarpospora sp. B8E8]|uniref:hypothetical protein n=1 Tax=Acrocarpospora sp. B8E8 TaxID=3153572 RepID=UPI00325F8909
MTTNARPPDPGQQPRQHRQQRPVRRRGAHRTGLAAQDGKLMAKDEYLDVLTGAGT